MNDLLDDLAAANPVPDPDGLAIPAPLAVRALARPAPRPPRAPRRHLLPAAGALAAAGAAVALLLLVLGGGAGAPDLAARAYAAARPHGVTHWRIDIAQIGADGRQTSHQKSEGYRRGATLHVVETDYVHGKPHTDFDLRQVGHRVRTWTSVSDTTTTTTLPRPRRVSAEDAVMGFGDPMLAFRAAYEQHRLRDLGGGRFDVVFRHLPAGSVVYEVDPGSGAPRRLVIANGSGTRTIWTFSAYETLPDTAANRARLLLLPHPGAGPGDQDPVAVFRALRDGARPPVRWQRMLERLAPHERRFGVDPSTARVLIPGTFLVAGRHYVCLYTATPATAPLGGGLGGTCVPIKQAIRNGISEGTPARVVVAVPDGVRAVQARFRWHGAWRRVPLAGGAAILPRLGYQVRLVR